MGNFQMYQRYHFFFSLFILILFCTTVGFPQGATYSTDNLPSTGEFVGYDAITFPGTPVQIRLLSLHQMSPQSAPPSSGSSSTYSVQGRYAVCYSVDNGATWSQSSVAPGAMSFSAQYSSGTADERLFSTELLSIELNSGSLPTGMRFRESPTLASLGSIRIRNLGSSGQDGVAISSFFDIFTELSLDGGASWIPSSNACKLQLHNSAPTHIYVSDSYPPEGTFASSFSSPPVTFSMALSTTSLNKLLMEVDSGLTAPAVGLHDISVRALRISLSLDGGVTLNDYSASATMKYFIHAIHAGSKRFCDMEITQLDIAGGTLPGGVMVRESPSKQSLGRTRLGNLGSSGQDGVAISSFFDVFTEISLDGGATWTPASEPVCLDLSSSPPSVSNTTNNFPPDGMDVVPSSYGVTTFENGVSLRNLQLRRIGINESMPDTPLGVRSSVSSFFDVFCEVSIDGLVWSPRSNVSPVTFAVTKLHTDGPVYFETEMLLFDVSSSGSGSSFRLRESPTLPSKGKTSLRLQSDGTFQVSSFFDVFTEISLDGGTTWSPSTAPTHFELTTATPSPRPVIASITPSSGPVGTIITIIGSGFSAVPSENFVSLGDNTPIIKGSSFTELRVVLTQPISPLTGGTVPVSVTVGGLSNLPPGPEFTILSNAVSYLPNISDLSIRDIKTGDVDGDGRDDIIMLGAKGNCCRGHVIIMKAYEDGSFENARPFIATVTYGEDEDCDGLATADSNGDGVVDQIGVVTHKSTGERKVYIVGGLENPAGASIRVKNGQFTGGPGTVKLQRLSNDDSLDIVYGTPAGGGQPAMVHVVKNFDKPGESVTRGLIVGGEECDDANFSDLDSDGDLDIVAATGGGIYVFQNNQADFEFLRTQIVDDGKPYSGVAVGDLDGDGHADIVALRSDSGIVNVFFGDPLNNGRVIPTAREAGSGMATGRRQYEPLKLADVNGDGIPDIVCVSGESNQTVRILLVGGALPGGAIISARMNMDDCDDRDSDNDGIVDAKLFAVGKFDTDNDCDFAFASCRSTTINPPIVSNFSPDISPAGTLVAIEGDNLQDASSVQIGDLDATFIRESPTKLLVTVPATARTHAAPHVFETMRVTCPSGVCAVVKPFTVSPVIANMRQRLNELETRFVSSGDVDGDGKDEIVMLGTKGCCRGHVIIMKAYDDEGGAFRSMAASGAMVTSFFYGEDEDCDGMSVGDLDGDGRLDVCVALTSSRTGSTSFRILLGDSTRPGMFRESPTKVQKQWLPANFRLRSIASRMGDIDGDGKADIVFSIQGTLGDTLVVVTNPLSTTGFWLSKKGYDYYQAKSDLVIAPRIKCPSPCSSPFDVFVVGDTVVDRYAWSSGGSGVGGSIQLATRGKIRVVKDQGNGNIERQLTIGDLDGDGLTDAVVLDDDSSVISVCLDKGDGTFRLRESPSKPSLGKKLHLVVTDFDGDGKLDIAIDEPGVHLAPPGTTYPYIDWTVLLNRTQPTDTTVSLVETSMTMDDQDSTENEVAVGDFDGDGFSDIVVTGASSTVVRPPFIEAISTDRAVAGRTLWGLGGNLSLTSSVELCGPCENVPSFSAVSDSELTFVLPPSYGQKYLTITNPDGSVSLASPITILAVPDMFVSVPPESLMITNAKGGYATPVKRKKGLYPNWINLLQEVVVQGGFQPGATESDQGGGMRVGISKIYEVAHDKWKPIKDSAKIHAWVVVRGWDFNKKIGKNWANIQKTLWNKTYTHTGLARGFDSTKAPGDAKRKFLKGELTKLDPKVTPNKLFAELVALKFNIAASQLGKTPPGFGELLYQNPSNMFDGKSVLDISHAADTAMTYYTKENPLYTAPAHEGVNPLYEQLYEAVHQITHAFLGPLDTATFENGPNLTVNGVVDLTTVPFLKFPDGPVTITQLMPTTRETSSENEESVDLFDIADLPSSPKLYQNYPNPFNPTTTLTFALNTSSVVTLKIFNILGQEVTTLMNNEEMDAGFHQAEFSAETLASGLYFSRVMVTEHTENGDLGNRYTLTNRMLLLK
jgi:hypothetical protein